MRAGSVWHEGPQGATGVSPRAHLNSSQESERHTSLPTVACKQSAGQAGETRTATPTGTALSAVTDKLMPHGTWTLEIRKSLGMVFRCISMDLGRTLTFNIVIFRPPCPGACGEDTPRACVHALCMRGCAASRENRQLSSREARTASRIAEPRRGAIAEPCAVTDGV